MKQILVVPRRSPSRLFVQVSSNRICSIGLCRLRPMHPPHRQGKGMTKTQCRTEDAQEDRRRQHCGHLLSCIWLYTWDIVPMMTVVDQTHLRKKWNRSLMSKKAFFPVKNAWRAREISRFEEYLIQIKGMQQIKRLGYVVLTRKVEHMRYRSSLDDFQPVWNRRRKAQRWPCLCFALPTSI